MPDTIKAINNVIKCYTNYRRNPEAQKKLKYWFELKHSVRYGRKVLSK